MKNIHVETSLALGGVSYTTKDIELTEVVRGWVALRKPMDVGVRVVDNRGPHPHTESSCATTLEQGVTTPIKVIPVLSKEKM